MVCAEGETGHLSTMTTTIAAIATAAGRGGIGVIRLSGPDSLSIAMRLCQRHEAPPARHATLVRAFDEAGSVLDEGLLLWFPAPASFTGEDVIEFQGHGSQVLLQALLQRCLTLGARPAGAGEFSRRAICNGRMDLSQAEGLIACIDAATERAARQAQRHLSGDFGRIIQQYMQQLLGIVAHAEACLDFPEEDIPELFLDELRQQLEKTLIMPLQTMLRGADFGERLFQGATVAIIGAPNVGKSSLLNALGGRERAIVSDQAGTTRDVLEVDFEVHGIPVRLLDTAGIRDSDDVIEQVGVARARTQAAMADVCLFVADATQPTSWTMAEAETADMKLMNKTDLMPDGWQVPTGFLAVSVRQGYGIDSLLQAMAHHLGDEMESEETLLITRARHRDAIERTLQALRQALPLMQNEASLDLATLQLRRAHSALAEIVGFGSVDDILDRVFSEFCIGK